MSRLRAPWRYHLAAWLDWPTYRWRYGRTAVRVVRGAPWLQDQLCKEAERHLLLAVLAGALLGLGVALWR